MLNFAVPHPQDVLADWCRVGLGDEVRDRRAPEVYVRLAIDHQRGRSFRKPLAESGEEPVPNAPMAHLVRLELPTPVASLIRYRAILRDDVAAFDALVEEVLLNVVPGIPSFMRQYCENRVRFRCLHQRQLQRLFVHVGLSAATQFNVNAAPVGAYVHQPTAAPN